MRQRVQQLETVDATAGAQLDAGPRDGIRLFRRRCGRRLRRYYSPPSVGCGVDVGARIHPSNRDDGRDAPTFGRTNGRLVIRSESVAQPLRLQRHSWGSSRHQCHGGWHLTKKRIAAPIQDERPMAKPEIRNATRRDGHQSLERSPAQGAANDRDRSARPFAGARNFSNNINLLFGSPEDLKKWRRRRDSNPR